LRLRQDKNFKVLFNTIISLLVFATNSMHPGNNAQYGHSWNVNKNSIEPRGLC